MKAKGLTPILNVSDIAASFAWFEKWGWRKDGTGERRRRLEQCIRAKTCRFFCAWERKGDEGRERTAPRFKWMTMKPAIRARGCPCGWTMWMRCIRSVSPQDWM